MKIAVASDNGKVTEHFGHCQSFIIFEERGKGLESKTIPNPGHRPGFLPNYLHDLGVKVIISGGMGGGAVKIFKEKGIKVVTGVRGNAQDAARKYLDGTLESSNSVCHEHKFHDQC